MDCEPLGILAVSDFPVYYMGTILAYIPYRVVRNEGDIEFNFNQGKRINIY